MNEPFVVTIKNRMWSKRDQRTIEAAIKVRGCDVCHRTSCALWYYPGNVAYCAEHKHLGDGK